jgi:hypothetical protein
MVFREKKLFESYFGLKCCLENCIILLVLLFAKKKFLSLSLNEFSLSLNEGNENE